jgi:hypothetical protein
LGFGVGEEGVVVGVEVFGFLYFLQDYGVGFDCDVFEGVVFFRFFRFGRFGDCDETMFVTAFRLVLKPEFSGDLVHHLPFK